MQWRQIPLAFIGWRPRYVTLKTNGAWFVHTKRCLLGLLFSLNSGIQDSAVSCIVCIVQASSWPASLAGPHRVSEQLLWLKWGGGGACLNSQAIQPSILDMIYYTSEYNEIGAIIPPLWSHSLSLLIPPPYWSIHYHCLVQKNCVQGYAYGTIRKKNFNLAYTKHLLFRCYSINPFFL